MVNKFFQKLKIILNFNWALVQWARIFHDIFFYKNGIKCSKRFNSSYSIGKILTRYRPTRYHSTRYILHRIRVGPLRIHSRSYLIKKLINRMPNFKNDFLLITFNDDFEELFCSVWKQEFCSDDCFLKSMEANFTGSTIYFVFNLNIIYKNNSTKKIKKKGAS
jgi:hypothetical protein